MKLIVPLLFLGVLVAGLLLGRPGIDAGLIPAAWIEDSVGGNSIGAHFFACLAGALMYFATLTEIPILQGLLGQGMGQGRRSRCCSPGRPCRCRTLLVIRGVLGNAKTLAYASLVVPLSTFAGLI